MFDKRDRTIFGARQRLTLENRRLLQENELLRKVADAAVAAELVKTAGYRLHEINRPMDDAQIILADAENEAYQAFHDAVVEYRRHIELDARVAAAVAKLEDGGGVGECVRARGE